MMRLMKKIKLFGWARESLILLISSAASQADDSFHSSCDRVRRHYTNNGPFHRVSTEAFGLRHNSRIHVPLLRRRNMPLALQSRPKMRQEKRFSIYVVCEFFVRKVLQRRVWMSRNIRVAYLRFHVYRSKQKMLDIKNHNHKMYENHPFVFFDFRVSQFSA